MDNTQREKLSRLDFTPLNVAPPQPDSQPAPRPQTSSTDAPLSGNSGSRPGAPPTDDTVTFRPGDLLSGELNNLAGTTSAPPGQKPDAVAVAEARRLLSAQPSGQDGSPEERKAAIRRALENITRDELIDFLVELDAEQPAIDITQRILKLQVEEASSTSAESYKIPDDLAFVRLPVVRKTAASEPTPTWRVVLVSLDGNSRPLGLLIDSEIAVGRVAGNAMPDLDLTPFGAKNKGVSRIHARFRPSLNNLLLIDNDSSNGTFWNRLRIAAQAEQPIKDGDVIAFGRVNFLVKIVKAPDLGDTKTLF